MIRGTASIGEQAHNDYLQTLSDGGIVGGVLGLAFILILSQRFARRETDDKFRRGVATGALAGCSPLSSIVFSTSLCIQPRTLLFRFWLHWPQTVGDRAHLIMATVAGFSRHAPT
jgi:O-antigen ligase